MYDSFKEILTNFEEKTKQKNLKAFGTKANYDTFNINCLIKLGICCFYLLLICLFVY